MQRSSSPPTISTFGHRSKDTAHGEARDAADGWMAVARDSLVLVEAVVVNGAETITSIETCCFGNSADGGGHGEIEK